MILTIAAIAIALIIAGLGWILVAANSRGPKIIGGPTPDEARIVLEHGEKETDKAAEEAKSAPLDQKVDRFRALRELGRVRRNK